MKIILFCCFVLLFACGCRKSNNNDNTNSANIFPNKVGDTWLYLVNDTTVNSDTTVISGDILDSTAAQYNMTVSVIGSMQLTGGIKANVWVYNYPEGTDTNYVYQTGDTIRFLNKTKSYFVRQYIIPLRLHNSWQYAGLVGVTVDMQADIMVGQTNFLHAFHIFGFAATPGGGAYSTDEWIENNVGVVKSYNKVLERFTSSHLVYSGHYTLWSLVSYHIN